MLVEDADTGRLVLGRITGLCHLILVVKKVFDCLDVNLLEAHLDNIALSINLLQDVAEGSRYDSVSLRLSQ